MDLGYLVSNDDSGVYYPEITEIIPLSPGHFCRRVTNTKTGEVISNNYTDGCVGLGTPWPDIKFKLEGVTIL